MAGGRPAWTVPTSAVEDLALNIGRVLTGSLVARLDAAAEEEGAFRAGLRALERRAHSRAGLGAKLARRGHGEAASGRALDRLTALGLLDDAAFAREYAALRTQRGHGPVRLRHDLRRLGVAEPLVEAALRSLPEPDDEPLSRPRELAQRRARQLTGLPRDARKRRLLAFLGRRGYRGAEARAVVEDVLRRG
jgi:regulatory protein